MTTKISSVVVTSTDNILISKYISTVYLGIYSNYTLFVSMIRTIITKAFEGLTGSVGNLATCEDHEKSYKVYSNAYFINFWIVGFCVSMFYLLVDSFIKVWIGDSYILEWGTVALIAFNLYFRLMRNTNLVFIETYGLFRQMRVKSISEAAINLVASLFYYWHLIWEYTEFYLELLSAISLLISGGNHMLFIKTVLIKKLQVLFTDRYIYSCVHRNHCLEPVYF